MEPLTPPDCDLRGLAYMPLDTIRILDSDIFALSTGDEFKAALALWCKSWVQIPAASLPDDDRVLAHLSGSGRKWPKVRDGALRNWVKCSDGRLYHPVVAEKALAAFDKRNEFNEKKNSEADRKKRERDERKRLFEDLRTAGVTPPFNIKTNDLRDLHSEHVSNMSRGCPADASGHVTAKRGKGEGEVRERDNINNKIDSGAARAARIADDFIVPDEWLEWACKERHWDMPSARSEGAGFVDYWKAKSGKDATKLDWHATWRNWVRNSRRPGIVRQDQERFQI